MRLNAHSVKLELEHVVLCVYSISEIMLGGTS